MTDVIEYVRLSCRGYSAAEMASRNDVLKDRELGWETDTLKCKLGDGVTAYNSLPYAIRPVPTLVSAFTNDAGYLTSASFGAGVYAFLGTPTSANLRTAVTDETGSGPLVFGTSPNITTPTGIVPNDIGLGNVLNVPQVPASYLDTDTALAANSDVRVATQKATKAYVDQIVAAQDAMVFKGVIDCSANPNYPAADRGWTYRASVAGKIGGASGVVVQVGDIILCLTDGTAAGNQATVGSNWSVIQCNIDGALTTADLGVVVQAYSATLLALASATANGVSLVTAANYAAMRTLLNLVPGTDVQGYSAALTAWAAITPGTGVGTFISTPTSANLRAALTDETGTGSAVFATNPTLLGLGVTGLFGATGASSMLEQNFGVDADGQATFPHAFSSGFAYLKAPSGRGFRFRAGTTTLLDFPAATSGQLSLGYGSVKIGDSSGSGTSIYLCSIGISDLNLRAGDGDVSRTADVIISVKNNVEVARFTDTRHLLPGADNVSDFGSGSLRWATIYAGTGTINTSDERYKVIRDGGDLTEAEYLAWGSVRAIVYQDKDAFERKGRAARMHVGYSWQAIRAAFEAQGLDASQYALWCEDPVLVRVSKTRPAMRQVVGTVYRSFEEVQLINGAPVLVRGFRPTEEPAFVSVPVVDGDTGEPVVTDDAPLMADVPVMEAFEEEYTEVIDTGETMGALRYQECSVFETAWLRRRLALVEDRLAALEPG